MRVSHLAPQWHCSSDWPAVAEVRKVIPARKDPPVRRAMQVRSVRPVLLARPGHRAKKARPVRQARVSGSSDQTAFPGCSVQCQDNEVLITAYCGPTRNQAQFVGERGASCGPPAPPIRLWLQFASARLNRRRRWHACNLAGQDGRARQREIAALALPLRPHSRRDVTAPAVLAARVGRCYASLVGPAPRLRFLANGTLDHFCRDDRRGIACGSLAAWTKVWRSERR